MIAGGEQVGTGAEDLPLCNGNGGHGRAEATLQQEFDPDESMQQVGVAGLFQTAEIEPSAKMTSLALQDEHPAFVRVDPVENSMQGLHRCMIQGVASQGTADAGNQRLVLRPDFNHRHRVFFLDLE